MTAIVLIAILWISGLIQTVNDCAVNPKAKNCTEPKPGNEWVRK